MTPVRIAELFELMRDREEGVNNFVYDALLSQMFERRLRAAIPVRERAHAFMAS